MKETYETPKLELLIFETIDIIMDSNETPELP